LPDAGAETEAALFMIPSLKMLIKNINSNQSRGGLMTAPALYYYLSD
jgi:hypothetical protein